MLKIAVAFISAGLFGTMVLSAQTPATASGKAVHPTCYDRKGYYTARLQPKYCGLTTYYGSNLPTLVLSHMTWTGKRKGRATIGFTDKATGEVIRRVKNARFAFRRPIYVKYVMGTGEPGWQYSRFTTQGKTYITARRV